VSKTDTSTTPIRRLWTVDDEAQIGKIIGRWTQDTGIQTTHFTSGEACLAALPNGLPDVVLLDLRMPGLSGLETLERLTEARPEVSVIMATGEADTDTVVRAMRAGAIDYLVKPLEKTRLLTTLEKTFELIDLRAEVDVLSMKGPTFAGMLGESAAMKQLFRAIRRVAPSGVSVLVLGESGTGKELVAQALHSHSERKGAPLVAVNCAAIPASLQESELFGHERGSFTGAVAKRVGRFEEADGGTLFLDEVAELSPELQAKLLRVLQERSFRRVGGTNELRSDFRLLAATHRDLFALVGQGQFREDLYYRLAVFEIETPALRDRGSDVALLANAFIAELSTKLRRDAPILSKDAKAALVAHRWPGNVRELRNAMQYAVTLCTGATIELEHLPPRMLGAPIAAQTSGRLPLLALGDLERLAIEQALEQTEGRVGEAAEILGINRTTLYRKLKQLEE